MDIKKMFSNKHSFDWQSMTPGIASVLLAIVIAVGVPNVWKDGAAIQTISNLFLQMSGIGVVAMGTLLVLLTAGIDFSAGWGTALAGVTGGYAYLMTESLALMIVVSVATGLALGICNGLIITRLGLKPFVGTLAMMAVCQGLSQLVLNREFTKLDTAASRLVGSGTLNAVYGVTYDPGNLLTWPLQIITVPVLVFAAVSIFTYLFLNKTRTGVYIYAIGGREESAKLAGVNVNNVKLMAYSFAGLFYGVASVIILCRIGQITPNISGTLQLDSIAATVIGGTSVAGGKGTVGGTVLGLIVIQLLSSAMIFFGLPSTLFQAVIGLAILSILVMHSYFLKHKTAR